MIRPKILIITLLFMLTSAIPRVQKISNPLTFHMAPNGAVKPKGWILKQLERDLNEGYIGKYGEVNETVNQHVFFKQKEKSRKRWAFRKEWWNGEHEGYWKDALVRMAWLTNDHEYQKSVYDWMDELLSQIDSSGYIGIYQGCDSWGCRFQHRRGNGELWVTSRMLMGVLALYEFTGELKFYKAAEKATRLIMDAYSLQNYFIVNSKGGGVSHGVGFFEILDWMYRLTGDSVYLTFAEKLYDDFNKGNVRDDDLKTELLLDESKMFQNHGAHIAEGFFIPQFIACINESDRLDKAAENALKKLTYHQTPSGAMRCDEWIKGREGTADERYEYCGIAELISPLNRIISYTGDLSIADKVEKMTFNAGQGARFPILKGLSYFTSDNRIKINHRELIKREHYDAAHFAAACCALNGARLMPYYVEGMWMKKENDAVAAILFGPSEFETTIKGEKIRIVEHTEYPFEDEIRFEINADEPVAFRFIIRKPHNVEEYSINTPRGTILEESSDYIELENTWNPGDLIHIKFYFDILQHKQPESKTVENGGVYLQRGPLVYGLPFPAKVKKQKEYHDSGHYRYKIVAEDTRRWNMALDVDKKIIFQPADSKSAVDDPWKNTPVTLEVCLSKDNKSENATLVPMGSTIFRRVTFETKK